MKWSWRLARIAGIDVKIHATFLLLLLWIGGSAWADAHSIAAALGGIGFAVLLFAIVVAHELGHAMAARHYGIRTVDITLLPIGGVARLERMPREPRAELVVAIAGPAVNLVLALVFAGLALAIGSPLVPTDVATPDLPLVSRLVWTNLALLGFNILPAFPMDGGRVLRAALAMRMDHARATRIAAGLGQAVALGLGFLGLFGSPVLVFIALFVWMGAASESAAEQIHDVMVGLSVRDAMVRRFETLAVDDSLADASAHVLAGFQTHFPVLDDGRLLGMLTHEGLIGGLTERGAEARVAAVMTPTACTVDPRQPLEGAFEAMNAAQCRAAPVLEGGALVGMLTLEGLGELVAIRGALAQRRAARSPR